MQIKKTIPNWTESSLVEQPIHSLQFLVIEKG